MIRRPRAFTLVELMVVISIIALLVGILLPAISRARDNAKIGQSKSNIRNIHTASNLYENDHKGRFFSPTPDNMASGPDGSWTGLNAPAAVAAWNQRYYTGQQSGPGGKSTIELGIQSCETDDGGHYFRNEPRIIFPYLYGDGLTISIQGYARTGAWRFPNTRQIAEYMEDKCYHKSYFAPKDRILQRALQQCWDDSGTTCSTTFATGNANATLDIPFTLQASSYAFSPPNMMNPYCYRLPRADEQPTEAFSDPMSVPAGFRMATAAQAKYSSLKTFLMEMHWMQNLTTGECGPRWDEADYPYHAAGGSNNDLTWEYDGCYPNYFNASWRSAPVATFMDGHVDMITVDEAEKWDYVVADGNNSTNDEAQYKGLWHRGVAGDLANGFFVECRTDWGNWSGHTHTAGGVTEGRDILAE